MPRRRRSADLVQTRRTESRCWPTSWRSSRTCSSATGAITQLYKCSAVPVVLLALPWLSSAYDPCVKKTENPLRVKKTENPLHYSVQSPSPKKNLMWLKMVIGKYVHKLAEAASTGKAVNLPGLAAPFGKATI